MVGVFFFFDKVADSRPTTLLKRISEIVVFLRKFRIFSNIFFHRKLRVTASESANSPFIIWNLKHGV